MTPQGDEAQEFYIAVAVYGGVIFAGALISIGLIIVGIAVKNRLTKTKIIKELYNGKEKNQNGQAKGGSRGHW